jgi:hypothetical protein
MSSIFHGGNTYIFYNTDANNNIPTSVTYKNIDELGAFPQVKINSSTTSLETYNDEWVQVLSGNMSIDSVSIVVHYIATNDSHQFLDNAFSNSTNFQIKVSLYESQDSLDQHYVILNGYISGYTDSGDQNEVYNRTYTFVAEDLITRGTAQDPPQLKQGDFGIGSDGETYPQYESETPTGNSFIKVPALRADNPINGDLGGFAFVDNGGDKTAQLAMPSEGNLGIYIKNTDHDWLSVPLKATNDALYVPLTRTINGKVLSSNITLSASDVSALPLSGGTLTGELTGTDATYSGTVQANGLTLTNALPVTQGGTGNITGNAPTSTLAASSTKLATARTVRTNLASTSTASFDGSANITPGVTGTLPIANGGTGNTTGLAASATKLATARTVTINLASSTAGSFDGTSNITPGVSGILSLANGGTGAATSDDALVSLGIKALGLGADTLSTITDFNTVTISGLYRYTSTTANSPFTGQSGTMIHLPYSTTYCSQMAFHIGQTSASVNPQIYQRVMVQGTWTAWKQYASAGINSDITSFTALSGPLTLGGDAQQDAQAVTLRQLTAATAGGGSGGATLNGVMNNFLGAVEWFNGTRASLPSGHLAADGQLLKRADYPDIWNAISTGVLLSNTDSAWQSTPTSRGVYSTGDGSTTFRMPDLNGVWVHPTDSTLNSIPALFLRGDGTVANTGTGAGVIRWGAIPNITGAVNINMPGTANFNIATATTGALAPNASATILSSASGLTYSSGNAGIKIDASISNVAYGRDSSTEVRPNSVKGIWLIRVNGLYSASNTNFNVINGITAAPATGAVVYGGDVRSNLQLNGADYVVGRMRTKLVGGSTPVLALGLTNSTGSTVVNTEWTLPAIAGELVSKAESGYTSINGKTGGTISSALTVNGLLTTNASINTNGAMTVWSQPASSPNGAFSNAPGLKSRLNTRGAYGDSQGAYGVMYMQEYVGNYHQLIFNLNGFASDYNWFMRAGGQTFSPLGELQYSGSDVRLKSDFTQSPDGALDRINKIGSVEFTLNASGRRCRGYVAQQLQDIDELYTFEGGESVDENGDKFNILNVDQTAIVSDLVAAVQLLSKNNEELTSAIKYLQSKLEDK